MPYHQQNSEQGYALHSACPSALHRTIALTVVPTRTRQASMPFVANAQGTLHVRTPPCVTQWPKLFQEAGYTVTLEAAVTGSLERPADLRVHCWNGRPLAIDFTIVTPTATSAVRGPAAELLLDHAAMAKMRKSLVNIREKASPKLEAG